MSWKTVKEFLKPDWKKIVLWIIILLFIPMPNLTYYRFPQSPSVPGPKPTPQTGPALNLFLLMLWAPDSFISSISEIWVTFIGFLIISYVLSCLTVRIYDKVKNK